MNCATLHKCLDSWPHDMYVLFDVSYVRFYNKYIAVVELTVARRYKLLYKIELL